MTSTQVSVASIKFGFDLKVEEFRTEILQISSFRISDFSPLKFTGKWVFARSW